MGFIGEKAQEYSSKATDLFKRTAGKAEETLFGPRKNAAPDEGILGGSVRTIADVTNASVTNALQKTSEFAGETGETVENTVAEPINALKYLVRGRIFKALGHAAKSIIAIPNEAALWVGNTTGTAIKGIRDAAEGIRRPLDQVAHTIGSIPVVGGIAKGVVNAAHKVFGAPIDIVDAAREKVGSKINNIFKWVRGKIVEAAPQAGLEQAA
ncbi:hypothetical protein HOE67_03915 [Candidatus Peregrinibacteria bacterium]|jgi:hypothetical protein|nr:hypothetical protein [Candidatus Peregrinibacteria bacterium]MBT4056232.1 hypothetical protein [Candidatus Peregrinibacteria bacterium]